MNLRTYQEQAKTTMNDELSPRIQLTSMALGLAGEFAELTALHLEPIDPSKEQIMDEGGDVMWYTANLCNVLSLEIPPMVVEKNYQDDPEALLFEAPVYYGGIADIVKKHIAQGHVLDIETLSLHLHSLVETLAELFSYYELTPEKVCTFNIEKLKKRYPNGFEEKRSVHREI